MTDLRIINDQGMPPPVPMAVFDVAGDTRLFYTSGMQTSWIRGMFRDKAGRLRGWGRSILLAAVLLLPFAGISQARITSKMVCAEKEDDWTILKPPGFSASTTYLTNRPSMAFIILAGPSNAYKVFGNSLSVFFMKKSLKGYDETKLELFGMPAVSFDYDIAKDVGINMHMRVFIIFDRGQYFSITFGALKSEFANEQPFFDGFLKTCDIEYK